MVVFQNVKYFVVIIIKMNIYLYSEIIVSFGKTTY